MARLLHRVPNPPVDSPQDIIPISSRRGPRPPGVTTPPACAAHRRLVPGTAWAVGLGALGMVVGLAVGQWRGIDCLRALPDGVRADAYARAMKDIQMVCN